VDAARLKDSGHHDVRLQLSKGVLLILTIEEYVQGLKRGKAERRAQRRQAHQARTQAGEEAGRLAWIGDGEA
jgi:hypothetical protein